MSRKKFVPNETKRPPSITVEQAISRDDKAIVIAVAAITITSNPRSTVGDLDELRESIKANGILNPLLVAKTPEGFQLLGGHRRLECAKNLGLAHVPCRIIDTEKPEMIKLVDNVIREELSPEDECLALKRLLPAFDGNKSALARAISKSPSYVNRAVKAAWLIENGLCAGAQLSKTALLELADASDPKAVLLAATDGKKESIREGVRANLNGRKASGPIAGGRAVAQALQFKQSKLGGFRLKINFSPERTPPAFREEIIRTLERLLSDLKNVE